MCNSNVYIAGAGKTKLVSQVIDSLGHKRHGEALVYFYCNRNEESRRKPEEILCSFIKQLAISDDQKAVHATLVRSYDKRWQTGFSSRTLSLNECEKLLIELVSTYVKVIIILDALDEIEESSRKKLLDCFNHFT
jgi:Cdc6-like AAA superfamily ATPase